MTPKAATKTDSQLAARVSAIASLGAAVIHFAVLPTHWREWLPSGIFFASIAAFQLIWAFRMFVRPGAAVLVAGIVANFGSIAIWGLSRTAGTPFGPHAGEPEAVQAAGIFALMLQCYVVMGAVWLWYRGRRADLVPGFGYGMVLIGAATVIGTAAALGVVSGLQHNHHSPVGAEHDHRTPNGEVEDGHHLHPAPVAPSDLEISPQPTAPAPVELSGPETDPEPAAPAPIEPSSPTPGGSHENDDDHHHVE